MIWDMVEQHFGTFFFTVIAPLWFASIIYVWFS